MDAVVWADAGRSGPKAQGTGEGEREAQETFNIDKNLYFH